jgi:hypothetical protein
MSPTIETAYLTSAGWDAGAQANPSERSPWMGAVSVRRDGRGDPEPARLGKAKRVASSHAQLAQPRGRRVFSTGATGVADTSGEP